jgi:transmembrane protein EpsG
MWIYSIIILLVVLPPIFYEDKKPIKVKLVNVKYTVEEIHIIVCLFALFLMMAFRGDFTSDYNSYVYLFNYLKSLPISDVLSVNFYFNTIELGYALLNILIGYFTDNYIWLFIASSIVILLPIYKGIIKYSDIKWFSVLLFFIIGPYFTSFNITRQIMAVSLVFAGIKHIFKRQYIKYILYVLLGCMFHITALIMTGFYFILLWKPRRISVIVYLAIGSIIYIFLFDLIKIIDVYIYHGYYTGNYSGISMASIGLTNALVPISIGIFTVLFRRFLDLNNLIHRVWFNGTLLWVLFKVVALQVFFLARIASFFSIFPCFLVPALLDKIKDNKARNLLTFLLVILFIIYFFVTKIGYGAYYTIWQ